MIWPHVLVSVFAVIATTNVDFIRSAPTKDLTEMSINDLHLDVVLKPNKVHHVGQHAKAALSAPMKELKGKKDRTEELTRLDSEMGSAFERSEKLKDDLYQAIASTKDEQPKLTMVEVMYERYVMLRHTGRQIEALMELLELDQFLHSNLSLYHQGATSELNSLYDQTISKLNDNQRLQVYGDLTVEEINMSASRLNKLLVEAKKKNPTIAGEYDKLINEVNEGRQRLLSQIH